MAFCLVSNGWFGQSRMAFLLMLPSDARPCPGCGLMWPLYRGFLLPGLLPSPNFCLLYFSSPACSQRAPSCAASFPGHLCAGAYVRNPRIAWPPRSEHCRTHDTKQALQQPRATMGPLQQKGLGRTKAHLHGRQASPDKSCTQLQAGSLLRATGGCSPHCADVSRATFLMQHLRPPRSSPPRQTFPPNSAPDALPQLQPTGERILGHL